MVSLSIPFYRLVFPYDRPTSKGKIHEQRTSGAAELRELGYVMTQDTVTPFGGEHHFNFLTPAVQEFAISYLVDRHFVKEPAFRIRDGEVFINNALISVTLRNWKTDSDPV